MELIWLNSENLIRHLLKKKQQCPTSLATEDPPTSTNPPTNLVIRLYQTLGSPTQPSTFNQTIKSPQPPTGGNQESNSNSNKTTNPSPTSSTSSLPSSTPKTEPTSSAPSAERTQQLRTARTGIPTESVSSATSDAPCRDKRRSEGWCQTINQFVKDHTIALIVILDSLHFIRDLTL